MPKGQRRSWRKAEIDDVNEAIFEQQQDRVSKIKDDAEIFVIDAIGARDGRRSKKRRLEELEGLPKKKAPKTSAKKGDFRPTAVKKTSAVAVQDKRPKITGKKKPKTTAEMDIWGALPKSETNSTIITARYQTHRKDMAMAPPKRNLSKPELHQKRGTKLIVADEGLSINPLPESQQQLLAKAFEQHQAEEAERQRIIKKLSGEDLPQLTLKPADEILDEDKDEIGRDVVKAATRKTIIQRNKEKRRKENEQKQKELLKDKQLQKQLQRIPAIVAELRKAQKERDKHKKEVEALKEASEGEVRLGKEKYTEAFPEVVLTEEIKDGSLREVTPTVRTLKDQVRRFEKKNVIEPRSKHKLKRRYKLKEYTRRSHRIHDDL